MICGVIILGDNDDNGGCYLLGGLLGSLLNNLFGNLRLKGLDDLNKGLKGLNNLDKSDDVSDGSKTCVDYCDSEM